MKHGEPEMTVESFLFKPWDLEKRCSVPMKAHQSYLVELIVQSRRHLETSEPTPHSAKLCFLEYYSEEESIEEAAKAASKADVSIIFAGRNDQWESEGSDLADLKLPMNQDHMIRTIAKASAKTIVVLYGGNPFDVRDWIEDVDAVLFAHYPGQEGATALTDILTGAISPSGKLPMTWPKNIESVPTFNNFPPEEDENGCRLDYKEQLKFGYRHYWDSASQESSRWDFGYGLSYTSFAFSNLKVGRKSAKQGDNMIEVEVTLENTGSTAGAETLQVYVEATASAVWRPAKELKQFEKIFLEPGMKQVVRLILVEKYALSYWDETSDQWWAEKGKYIFHVGNLTATMHLQESFQWKGL
jgi:beta-glucosidase